MEEGSHAPRRVRFAEYELDTRAGELRKAGTTLQLHKQPLQLLLLLLEHPGKLVTRDELRTALWPDHTYRLRSILPVKTSHRPSTSSCVGESHGFNVPVSHEAEKLTRVPRTSNGQRRPLTQRVLAEV